MMVWQYEYPPCILTGASGQCEAIAHHDRGATVPCTRIVWTHALAEQFEPYPACAVTGIEGEKPIPMRKDDRQNEKLKTCFQFCTSATSDLSDGLIPVAPRA